MNVTELRTLRPRTNPNLLFVEVVTDAGLVGLGETFFGAGAAEAVVHEQVAPVLLGTDARRIRQHAERLRGYVGSRGSGAETRARSAVDIALWDLLGQASGQPLHVLLGGPCRDRVQIYNTCAGTRYVQTSSEQSSTNWGLDADDETPEQLEDLTASIEAPEQLARDLLAQGITAMKIWPFDRFAERSNGHHISPAELEQGLDPVRRIRAAVGAEMDVMVELHGLWSVAPARRILRGLRELAPRWVEDPIDMDDAEGLAQLALEGVPLAGGETLTGTNAFRRVFERRALDIAIVDLGWCGGLTEALTIAGLAEAYGVELAPHDCTGPVGLAVGTHLSMALPNITIQEGVRAFYRSWYGELVDRLPEVADGHIAAPEGPGLGLALRADAVERGDFKVRVSREGVAEPIATA
jgi:L-alanine-DL-glutamate epimerase-like enolase superfamily enzyme